MSEKVRAFVFIDALGWKQVEKYGFLSDILPNRRSIEMQFGYSCTAIPTILTGERPDVHGHLAFYDYAPEKSPFKAMRFLAPGAIGAILRAGPLAHEQAVLANHELLMPDNRDAQIDARLAR